VFATRPLSLHALVCIVESEIFSVLFIFLSHFLCSFRLFFVLAEHEEIIREKEVSSWLFPAAISVVGGSRAIHW
jgi:hypothetical protein